MSKKKKLLERFLSAPKDLTYDELTLFLRMFNYEEQKIGHTTGSAVCFKHKKNGNVIRFHKPHPHNIIKGYIIKYIKMELEKEGVL